MSKAHRESNHLLQAALLSAGYKAKQVLTGTALNFEDPEVRKYFYRQDYMRFRPDLFLKVKNSGVASKSSFAFRLSRAAHQLHGLSEVFASPEGFTFNCLQNAVAPRVSQKGMHSKIQNCILRMPLGILIGSLSKLVNNNTSAGINQSVSHSILSSAVGTAMIVSPSALSSLSGLGSLVLGGISARSCKRTQLDDSQIKQVEQDQKDLFKKIDQFMLHMRPGTQGHRLLVLALNKKISRKYRDENTGQPTLLGHLISQHSHQDDSAARILKLQSAVARYLSDSGTQVKSQNLRLRDHVERQKHFAAFCNLIDHEEIDATQKPESLPDLRERVEKGFKAKGSKYLKSLLLSGSQSPKQAGLADASANGENYTSLKRILKHRYQYGPLTRRLATASEACRRICPDLIQQKNAQVSRLFYKCIYKTANALTYSHPSRVMCFSAGRFLGGGTLAVIFALLGIVIGPLALGDGFVLSYLLSSTGVAVFMTLSLLLGAASRIAAANGGFQGKCKRPLRQVGDSRELIHWNARVFNLAK